ncbi:tripartite tricarboxylate transporter permease [Vreelandella venusta]|uniref:Tripartite tricarboxylate transporter TctA family protein n=1 Tax=Vreelandella venusta TaxID=44935 RepID=A0ABX2BBP5_9GAMM|nr:tripartite tricarboxylate transporter permease [Halomonas venusta]AZM96221.1 tripartite tricarboxylate transporter TctA family protein [Halomonas venusta]MDW0358115.1 tripartite tricarboxylate transporter permease [Halomonas venusta]NPT30479.1 tripartite tricarboxylate transporter TctA family protein [Halomonas venusta]
MDPVLLLQMLAAAIIAVIVYTAIGVAPGTDETAVLAPVTLALVVAGIPLPVVLAFFMAAIVAKKLTDSIPVSVAGIPGGVMSAPMVEHALILKREGHATLAIRKMASGSVIGTLVAIPISLFLAFLLTPLADVLGQYASQIFFGGAVFLALMSKEKVISLISIVLLAALIQGLRHLYWGMGVIPEGQTVFISFFLGITIGPMMFNLARLTVNSERHKMAESEPKQIQIYGNDEKGQLPNPFRILTRQESASAAASSVLGSVTFFMSPVGITIFLGEVMSSWVKGTVNKASRALSSMDAVTNASYIAGILIPLAALGIPMSPMAIGPGNAFFNAPPVLTLEQNAHHLMSFSEITIASILGAGVALLITYPIAVRYARRICIFVFKHIPHEAFLAMFFSLVMLLAYMDAGVMGILGVMVLALMAGLLNRWGVNYGVQFMTLYAAPWLLGLIA